MSRHILEKPVTEHHWGRKITHYHLRWNISENLRKRKCHQWGKEERTVTATSLYLNICNTQVL
jgi:hypothetical protein